MRDAFEFFRHGWTAVGVVATKAVVNALPDGNSAGVMFKAPGPNDDYPNTVAVYVGNKAVTAGYDANTGGFPLAPGESVTFPLERVDELYAIATSGDQHLAWVMI